jgi:hypothetical protein
VHERGAVACENSEFPSSLSVGDMDLSFAHGENQFSITHFLCAAAAVLLSSASAAVAVACAFSL